eukprot:scaffold23069_cov36-Tisochrysis_lutea.AAC.8
MTQSALAKERRELRESQQRALMDSIPKDLNRCLGWLGLYSGNPVYAFPVLTIICLQPRALLSNPTVGPGRTQCQNRASGILRRSLEA